MGAGLEGEEEEEEETGLEAFNEVEEEESDCKEEEEEEEVVFVLVEDDIFCFPFIDTGDCLLLRPSLFSLVGFKPFLSESFLSFPGREQTVNSQRAA